MKSRTLLLALIIAVPTILQTSCKRDCIEGQGSYIIVDKTPNNLYFNKIEVSEGEVDVEISQDSVFKVELIAQPNLTGYFQVIQSNGRLIIEQTTKKCIESDAPLRFIVHLPFANNLNEVAHYGSGTIKCNRLETNYIYLVNNYSGDIDFARLTANDEVEVDLRGSGSIWTGKGSADRTTLNNSGSGNINADELICGESHASTMASGNIYTYVLNRLDANISGSGSIYFRGGPYVYESGQGSGEVIQMRKK